MEQERKKSSRKFWLYLTPVYIILALPLVRWTMKINSSDVDLSKEEYNVFNASEGEIKKRHNTDYNPDLRDRGYSVRYRSNGAESGELQGDGPGEGRSGNQAALESSETRVKEQMGLGNQKGYLSYAVGKTMNNPKAVSALLNNKYVVNGFMARGTVKAATASPEGLANYLKGSGPANFLNNSIVKAAMNNPAVVSAVASSGIVGALLNTPAAQALMNDPQALGDMINSNPELVALAMQNPQTLSMLMSNPEVSGLVGKFDTSKIKSY